MYHLELRKFPHVACLFNQSEQQLRAILVPWLNEEWIEEGEHKWNSNEATLIVLEGPKLTMPDLAMNRGWKNAQRRSEDVTERVLAAVRAESARRGGGGAEASAAADAANGAVADASGQAPGAGAGEGTPAAGAPAPARADAKLLADSLALELLGLLDAGPLALARAWALAQERLDAPAASQSLALGEQAVRSLLERGLVVLQSADSEGGQVVADDQIEPLLRAAASWSAGAPGSLVIARKT